MLLSQISLDKLLYLKGQCIGSVYMCSSFMETSYCYCKYPSSVATHFLSYNLSMLGRFLVW